jgi:UDP-N-acetylmuramate dehydrogenase
MAGKNKKRPEAKRPKRAKTRPAAAKKKPAATAKPARAKAGKPAKPAVGKAAPKPASPGKAASPARSAAPAKPAAPVKSAAAAKAAVPARAAAPVKPGTDKPGKTPVPPITGKAPAVPGKAPAGDAPAEPKKRRASAQKVMAPQLPPGVAPFPALNGTVKYEEPFARHTTFRIGGPAMVLFQPGDVDALKAALAWAKQHKLPWMVLGLGSNVLIRDGGFRGLVLKIGKGLDDAVVKGHTWKVGAGLAMPLLARRSAETGFEGVQRLIGVPGTVGGAVFMNAGAHGQDIASVLQTATVLTPAGEVVEKARKDIAFAYRRSGLDGHIVLGCALQLSESPAERVKADLNFVLKKRREGTPFDQPCCGSVFKNPPDTTAARLIEQCKLKGRRVGGAEISPLHANYMVNKGHATADDVLKLIDVARTAVFKEFGIELELEVKVLGAAK